jgi:hypothetical protein
MDNLRPVETQASHRPKVVTAFFHYASATAAAATTSRREIGRNLQGQLDGSHQDLLFRLHLIPQGGPVLPIVFGKLAAFLQDVLIVVIAYAVIAITFLHGRDISGGTSGGISISICRS